MLCIDFLGAIKNSLKKQKGNRAASLSLPGVALERKEKPLETCSWLYIWLLKCPIPRRFDEIRD